MTGILHPRHADELCRGSGISPDVAARRGYRSVTAAEARAAGFADYQAKAGLLIPRYTLAGHQVGYLLKPDAPRIVDAKSLKYEAPAGSVPHLDIHPDAQAVLRDPTTTLHFSEGEKKADALFSHGIPCVSLTGTFMFLRGRLVVPDLDEVNLAGRRCRVVFDSDVTRKASVAEALLRFCAALHRRGARVEVIYLPEGPGGAKVGVDDFLAAGGTVEELDTLARPWDGTGPGVWLQTANADDVAELRRRCDEAEAVNRLYATAIRNPELKRSDLVLMASVVPQALAKRARGETDAAGRVQLTAGEISEDYRPEPAPGQPLPPVNPTTGRKPRMPRATVKQAMTTAVQRGLLRAAPLRVTRSHANGNAYQDTVWVIDPAPSLRAMLDPWATYRPVAPTTRKPRTAPRPCPHCGEAHAIRRQDTCAGCGIVTERMIEPPMSPPATTPDNLSEVNTSPLSPPPSLYAGQNIGGAPEEPAWLADAPDPEPRGTAGTSDKLSLAPLATDDRAVARRAAAAADLHRRLAVASHPPTPDAGRQALQDLGADPARPPDRCRVWRPTPMIVIPVTAHRGRDAWSLTFRCPWCRGTHTHGGGPVAEPPDGGHRLSHCHHPAAPAGYEREVVAIEGAISPPAPRHRGVPA